MRNRFNLYIYPKPSRFCGGVEQRSIAARDPARACAAAAGRRKGTPPRDAASGCTCVFAPYGMPHRYRRSSAGTASHPRLLFFAEVHNKCLHASNESLVQPAHLSFADAVANSHSRSALFRFSQTPTVLEESSGRTHRLSPPFWLLRASRSYSTAAGRSACARTVVALHQLEL
jgi:hypothetical protein